MTRLVFILVCILPFNISDDYPLENGKPTSKGIERYIEDKGDSLIIEYQDFVQDSLFDAWIYTADMNRNGPDSLELGWYFRNEVIISMDPLFIAYELGDLSKIDRSMVEESNKFVKSTVFHELTHHYMYIISREMQSLDQVHVNRAYQSGMLIIRDNTLFGATFIEEGICEYQTGRMGEIIVPKKPFIPKTQEELTDINNRYKVFYKYAAHCLKPFLDTTGFKRGVKILIHNAPPSYEEILKPELFFSRLKQFDL